MRKNVRAAVAALFVLLWGAALALVVPVAPAASAPLQTVAPPQTVRCTVAQTVTAAAYASGNVVGGRIDCLNAARGDGFGGIIQSVMVRDKAGQGVAYDLFLFDAAPTAQTDKTAIALTAADLAKIAAPPIQLAGTVLGAAATMGITGAGGLGVAFKLSSGTTLYAILVVRGAPTYASTSDITVDIVILPD